MKKSKKKENRKNLINCFLINLRKKETSSHLFDASKQGEESMTTAGEDEYENEPREKHKKKRRRKEKNAQVTNSDAECSVVANDGESPPSTSSKETKKLKETERN